MSFSKRESGYAFITFMIASLIVLVLTLLLVRKEKLSPPAEDPTRARLQSAQVPVPSQLDLRNADAVAKSMNDETARYAAIQEKRNLCAANGDADCSDAPAASPSPGH